MAPKVADTGTADMDTMVAGTGMAVMGIRGTATMAAMAPKVAGPKPPLKPMPPCLRRAVLLKARTRSNHEGWPIAAISRSVVAMKILLLEDDTEIGEWVRDGLSRSGHVVDWLENGREALVAATTQAYDLLILDRMTPELDGLSVLKSLRAAKITAPALFLTALGDVDDRVEGLHAGADDYLSKPFAFSELEARVVALGRRRGDVSQGDVTTLVAGDISLDLLKQRCTRQGNPVDLNAKEFRLLEAFLRSNGRVLTRNMLLEKVWDMNFDPTTSVVETHVSRLRAKIEKPFGDSVIKTLRGAGYVFEPKG